MAENVSFWNGKGLVRSCTKGRTAHCAPRFGLIKPTVSRAFRRWRWCENHAFQEPSTFSQPAGAFGPQPRLTFSSLREFTVMIPDLRCALTFSWLLITEPLLKAETLDQQHGKQKRDEVIFKSCSRSPY